MTLEEAAAHIGGKVTYHPSFAAIRAGVPAGDEHGVITSVSERYVFVRYGTDRSSKATPAARLALIPKGNGQ